MSESPRRSEERSEPASEPHRETLQVTAEEHRARERLLTRAHASRITNALDAIVLEEGGLFLMTDPSGDVPFAAGHALGLYRDDCRFLDGLELFVEGVPPISLSATDERGFETIHHLANPDLENAEGEVALPANTLAIQRRRCIRDGCVYEEIAIHNYGESPVSIAAELRFRARFEDIFAVKKFVRDRPTRAVARVLAPDRVEHRCRGRDDVWRRMRLRFAEPPSCLEPRFARFDLEIEPDAIGRIRLSIEIESGAPKERDARGSDEPIDSALAAARARPDPIPLRLRSTSRLFDRVLRRASLDLKLLESTLDGRSYFAAGIPWFATLFGRDAAIVAFQTLPWQPATARDTLVLLARYQATQEDPFRDAQPGKILHELRRGELSHLGKIPQSPAYYGSIDATPLFLILLCAYVRWSGDLAFAREMRPAAERALAWLASQTEDHGFLEYAGAYENGLVNQGWKDSGDAMVDADGRRAEPPIALCEVQGYAYRAWRDVAWLWRSLGDESGAQQLEQRAGAMRDRFDSAFWSEPLGCYALARQAGGRLLAVASSNAGQVLWSGIAPPARSAQVAQRLLAPDMFSGWGVRTLSADARGYNPMSYHRGSVWPHDNALILAGLRRYGHDAEALQLFQALFDAASWCRNDRLPELYCGFPRTDTVYGPVPYPVACSPQAWAAGALPYALWTLLGISADATRGRLHLRRPRLPDGLDALEVRHLRVAAARVDLRLRRGADGSVEVDAQVSGDDLEVLRDDQLCDDS